jgi:hypothetical protein
MKTIAIILGLTAAALAQQPPTPRLYIHAPMPIPLTTEAFMKRCPSTVIITKQPEAAQYQLELDWRYAGFASIRFTAILFNKAGDSLLAFETKGNNHPEKIAERVCKHLETNKGKQP